MLNFDDFVKLNEDVENSNFSPFEKNWKSALLCIYRCQDQGGDDIIWATVDGASPIEMALLLKSLFSLKAKDRAYDIINVVRELYPQKVKILSFVTPSDFKNHRYNVFKRWDSMSVEIIEYDEETNSSKTIYFGEGHHFINMQLNDLHVIANQGDYHLLDEYVYKYISDPLERIRNRGKFEIEFVTSDEETVGQVSDEFKEEWKKKDQEEKSRIICSIERLHWFVKFHKNEIPFPEEVIIAKIKEKLNLTENDYNFLMQGGGESWRKTPLEFIYLFNM